MVVQRLTCLLKRKPLVKIKIALKYTKHIHSRNTKYLVDELVDMVCA